MTEEEIGQAIIAAAMKVHSVVGPGLLESAYETCLVYELEKRRIGIKSQVAVPIRYEELTIENGYRIDLLVGGLVVVELKAVAGILPVHRGQLLSYLSDLEAADMSDAKGLTRQQMCDRLAMEFQDGWVVNLGIGIPTLCSNFDFGDKEIIFHAENGVIGYGPLTGAGNEDLHLVNAGGQHVTLHPSAAIVHHADSFGLIRSGRIDVTVLGAYEVAENGDFANWKMAGQKGGGIGGAMDLAACAKHVFLAMEHVTRRGQPRLVERCAIPVTARGVVNLVITNYGLFEVTPEGMALREIAPGVTVDEIKASTGCTLLVPQVVPPVRLRAV